jgi:phage-related minor tail protein
MALIDEITENTVAKIADVITGNSADTVKSIVWQAINRAMADAYERGVDRGQEIADEQNINLQA